MMEKQGEMTGSEENVEDEDEQSCLSKFFWGFIDIPFKIALYFTCM